MKPTFKRLADQVMVITGASSGIGLATAEIAAREGARVVMAARSEAELADAVEWIRRAGGRATYVTADVSDVQQVEHVARHAVHEFGGIDTWVNNAGLGMYGRLIDQPLEEKRRTFEVNFWSVVHGCRAALPHLRERGGVIVNVGSQVSDRAAPLLGIYSAAKHAVKGYTDALRMELEHDGLPIWVSLVKPGPIDTPFTQHAANYMEKEPQQAPPVYPPEEVAYAILKCAQRPVREVTVGGVPRLQSAVASLAPRLVDLFMEHQLWNQMRSKKPAGSADSLYRPSGDDYGRRRGRQPGRVMKSSAYTRAALSDVARAAPFIAIGAAVAAAVVANRS
jgi:NAD(P)-dependent dehydrogenase (short-subunit alcohol dehydrogenase family)